MISVKPRILTPALGLISATAGLVLKVLVDPLCRQGPADAIPGQAANTSCRRELVRNEQVGVDANNRKYGTANCLDVTRRSKASLGICRSSNRRYARVIAPCPTFDELVVPHAGDFVVPLTATPRNPPINMAALPAAFGGDIAIATKHHSIAQGVARKNFPFVMTPTCKVLGSSNART